MDLKRVNQVVVVLSVVAAILFGSGWIIEEFGGSLELWGFTHVHGPLYAAAIGVCSGHFIEYLLAKFKRQGNCPCCIAQ